MNSKPVQFRGNADATEWHTGVVNKGVGPWETEHQTPLPTDVKYDPELLQQGDYRNVVDYYRYWSVAAIVADLAPKRHEFHVAIENLAYDNNIGTIVRTANAFLAHTVHLIGKSNWNRRSAMVTDKYQPISHHATAQEFVNWSDSENIIRVAVDNDKNAQPIETTPLPKKCVLIFGHEGLGISETLKHTSNLLINISQFGSTRSINVGVAAGIIMHQWISRYANIDTAW